MEQKNFAFPHGLVRPFVTSMRHIPRASLETSFCIWCFGKGQASRSRSLLICCYGHGPAKAVSKTTYTIGARDLATRTQDRASSKDGATNDRSSFDVDPSMR